MTNKVGTIPLPQMSQELISRIEVCRKLHDYLNNSLKGLKMGERTAVYGAYISIALEHFGAMLLLAKNRYSASAAALARPHFEACCKGMWVNLKASDSDMDKLWKGETFNFPNIEKLLKEIDVGYGANNMLIGFHTHWGTLCGFTHGGAEQLTRRFGDHGIHSTFTDEEMVKLLTLCAFMSTPAVIPLLITLGHTDRAKSLEAFHSRLFEWIK